MSVSTRELGQLLTFEQGGEECALPLLRVREIVELGSITRLPALPSYVLGVIDVRGDVVPVIDVAAKLGLGGGAVGKRSCVVVTELGFGDAGTVAGVLVDAVRGVIELSVEELRAIRADAHAANRRCWWEIERPQGRIWLLDIDQALDEEPAPSSEPTAGRPLLPEADRTAGGPSVGEP
jgi:chemotaxis signal transduction protein